jgi:hypothetical protein
MMDEYRIAWQRKLHQSLPIGSSIHFRIQFPKIHQLLSYNLQKHINTQKKVFHRQQAIKPLKTHQTDWGSNSEP